MVLVGHGSHRSPRSARPIYNLARGLREADAFEEVRVAFWKEEPSLRCALDLVESREVFVVPIFTSEGYFTDRVVPREMGIDGAVTHRAGRRIRYLPPIGTHPRMAEVVLERAGEAALLTAEAKADATLVLVGHGTDRHPRSAATTLAVAERLREIGPYGEVHAAFLDQDPEVGDLLSRLTASNVIVVPFFISEGWHAGTTIPRDLALEGGCTRRGDATVWYALPVGTHRSVIDVVRDLVAEAATASGAEDAGSGGTEEGDAIAGASQPVELDAEAVELHAEGESPAREARLAFQKWIREEEGDPRVFLEVQITRRGKDFEVRHVADREQPDGELSTLDDPEDAPGIAAVTADGCHRPLRTAPDLQAGWRFVGLSPQEVWEVVTHIYPAAPVHHHLARHDSLRTTSFLEVAGRQSGMYQGVDALSQAAVASLVDVCCAREHCLREPVWHQAGDVASDRVPCPEPCSLFISMAREELDRESGP